MSDFLGGAAGGAIVILTAWTLEALAKRPSFRRSTKRPRPTEADFDRFRPGPDEGIEGMKGSGASGAASLGSGRRVLVLGTPEEYARYLDVQDWP